MIEGEIIDNKYLIVAYDIENNKLRGEIAELLQYYGLVRIQYSVFAGEISKKNADQLSSILFDNKTGEDDNIVLFTICADCQKSITSLKSLPEKISHLSI
jgi:CRISPR-associated protein Cas2